MNPDIFRNIQSGGQHWTVYTTAGEIPVKTRTKGTYGGLSYAEGRYAGARAAYARSAKVANEWTAEPMVFGAHTVPTWYLNANPKIRIVGTYIHAAAGPEDNQGDLYRLQKSLISSTTPINGDPAYSRASFIAMLRGIMDRANPAYIMTGSTVGHRYGDNVDHTSSALLVAEANHGGAQGALWRRDEYEAYTIQNWPSTVHPSLVTEKREIWNTYIPYDPELNIGNWENVMDKQGWQAGRVFLPGSAWDPPLDFNVAP